VTDLNARLSAIRTRGELKRFAAALSPDEIAGLIDLLAARGITADPEDRKRLVRLALDRADAAQAVGTMTALDESFRCGHCDRDVPAHGRTARNHCPFCLRSRHVDVIPGDRASPCHGWMDPVRLTLRHGEAVILHHCRSCGFERNNRALTDGSTPDDPAALRALSAGQLR
jgi:hypothetical protein